MITRYRLKASAHEPLAELVRPSGKLHAEAHDQKHGRAVARPDRFVFDIDGVRANGCHLFLIPSDARGDLDARARLITQRRRIAQCSRLILAKDLIATGNPRPLAQDGTSRLSNADGSFASIKKREPPLDPFARRLYRTPKLE